MKARTRWIVVLTSFLIVLGAVLAIQLRRASQSAAMEAEVYYWIKSMEWRDRNRTESENQRRQLAGLRALGDRALIILERDLKYHPPVTKLLERIPFLQRFAQQPAFPGQEQEIRHRAVHFLGMLGADASRSAPKLLQIVSDSNEWVRYELALTLGRIGGDSPEVRAALTDMLADPSKNVQFSSAISLWSFARADPANIERVKEMITSGYLSWPSLCLMKFGEDARIFAPDLAQAIIGIPWSRVRAQGVHALWEITGNKQNVLAELESLAKALEGPATTDAVTGWTAAEDAVGHLVIHLRDDKEFRTQARPLLQTIRKNPNSQAHGLAELFLRKFDELDQIAVPDGSLKRN